MRKWRTIVVGIILFALLRSTPAHGDDTEERNLKTYIIRSGEASSVAQTVREFTGTNATIVIDSNSSRLLIMATEELHAQIAEIMKEADVPPKNVRIEVRIGETGMETDAGFRVSHGSSPMKVTRTGSGYKVQFSPEARGESASRSSMAVQTLLVSSGREATLFVGQQVPFLEWLIEYGRNWGYVQQDIVIREVGARLVVKPTVIGNGPHISVALIPELSGLVEGHPHAIRYTQAATQVMARDGQTISIGGFGKNQEFYDMFLAGVRRSGSKSAVDITMTAHIVGPSGK